MQLKPGDKLIHEERWNLEKVEGLNSEEALANYLENANSG
jgi:hypothetical protein